jgi:hypothetical protein
MSMGADAEGLACADLVARTLISLIGNYFMLPDTNSNVYSEMLPKAHIPQTAEFDPRAAKCEMEILISLYKIGIKMYSGQVF